MDMPHSLAIGPAPMEISGVENRKLAIYVANTPSQGSFGELHKFVLTLAEESEVMSHHVIIGLQSHWTFYIKLNSELKGMIKCFGSCGEKSRFYCIESSIVFSGCAGRRSKTGSMDCAWHYGMSLVSVLR